MMDQSLKLAQIVLLTGYLGAGKTTLINYILTSQKTYKVAVIQNEFADEMGIESPIIKDSEGKIFDKFYELPNGCVCCSAKGELLIAVEYFIKEYSDLDFILVETNGLADPSSTIQQFWVDQELKYPAALRIVHGIVPTHRFKELWPIEIFRKQIVYADMVLLNYIDKVDEQQITECEQCILSINPSCQIMTSSFCQFPLDRLFSPQPYKPQLLDIRDAVSLHVDQSITHCYLKLDVCYEKHQWERNIGSILWSEQFQVLRVKGILKVNNSPFVHSLQGYAVEQIIVRVNDTFELQETDTLWESLQDKQTKILFIGQQLDKAVIIQMLHTIV